MNKSALIDKIKELEGLSNDEKSALLGLLRSHKKYGLVWEDKPEDVEERLKDSLPVLTEVKDRAIISDSPDAPNHILIEGDNLEALTALSYTHEGKVDVIYIDPPYNTGNKDFIYNDNYVDSEDSFRHSKWLSFISKRLKVAKRLLSESGMILISIDDNEYHNLKSLCDEIFGLKNFVCNFIWKSKSGGANDARFVATDTENILFYVKDGEKFSLNLDNEMSVTTSYNREDENGRYALDRLDKQSLGYHESLDFPIVAPDGTVYTVYHKDPNNKVARWRWGKDTVAERYDELVFENGCVYTKNYESEGAMPRNLLVDDRFGRTRTGKTELFSIIGANSFDNPKPSKLITHFLKLYPSKCCTVLDFFAGSGTTMNAVLLQNSLDGGKRTCILCTCNEGNICTDVTYPRIKNIISGYKSQGKQKVELYSETMNLTKLKKVDRYLREANDIKESNRAKYNSIKVEFTNGILSVYGELNKNQAIEGLSGNTLRYYCTLCVDRERTMPNMRKLVSLATDMLCIKEDLYREEFTFGKLKLNAQIARYFNDGKHQMLVIYREEVIRYFVDEIEKMSFGGKLKVYLFAPDRYAFDDDFFGVSDKVQLCALPAAIYDAYQKVLPKHKPKYVEIEEVETDGEDDSTLF